MKLAGGFSAASQMAIGFFQQWLLTVAAQGNPLDNVRCQALQIAERTIEVQKLAVEAGKEGTTCRKALIEILSQHRHDPSTYGVQLTMSGFPIRGVPEAVPRVEIPSPPSHLDRVHWCHTESLSTSDDEEQETTTALPFLLRRSATMPLPQSTTRSKAALNRQRSLHSPGIISPRYGLLAAALVSRCEHEVDSRQNHSNAKQTSPSSLFFLT